MSHKNKIFYNYMTYEDALDEYIGLLNDDDVFASQWKNSQSDFEEWCEAHEIILVDNKEQVNQKEKEQLE